MDYAARVLGAPPGWRRYCADDLERLPHAIRQHELRAVPEGEMELLRSGESEATERILRAMFWPLVYHLEPELWDALACVEPIHPALLDAISVPQGRVVDVGAGSGRLTRFLAERARQVVAVEPSLGLGGILRRRLPQVGVLSAWAEDLPLDSHSFELTAACGALGPEPDLISELVRITRPGGEIVLISPEETARFVDSGWRHLRCEPIAPTPHPAWIDGIFGRLDPPHEMVMLRV